MRNIILVSFFSLVLVHFTYGQISFQNNTDLLGNQNVHSGVVFAASDLNGDGLDDILRFNFAQQAIIDFQNPDGTFTPENIGSLTDGDIWSAVIADFNEDGINDFITGSVYEPIAMVKILGVENYDISQLDGPVIFMQGASCADINNDGAIDYFACNDDFISNPYQNDGNGNLSHNPDLMDTGTTDPAFNSGNYGCSWVDYDNDGDYDMYLSKCRLGVIEPTDARRINRMFRNDGNGNFTDVAEEIGLRPLGQSWATEFADIDNDGDMDAFMINHDVNSMLYENDGNGNFTDISIEAGINLPPSIFENGLQVYMYDFDNDSYIDILVTSYKTFPYLYRNNGNQTFTRVSNTDAFGNDINNDTSNDLQSGAIGDFNNDGFLDLMAGFANGINLPNGETADRLYLNEGNANNYIKINLRGTESNLNGIGARIEINGTFGTLIREVKSGHGYGIMNTLQAHCGIGTATEITNIIVKWPSGCISVTENPSINSTIDIIEICGVVIESTTEICDNEPIIIDGVEINTPGVYTETVSTNGMDTIYQTTLIVHPTYNENVAPLTICHGATIIINDLEITETGDYAFTYDTVEGCDSIININVNILDPIDLNASIVDDWGTINGVGSITLDMTNVITPYTIEWSNGMIDTIMIDNLLPDDYTVTITDGNNCAQTFTYTVDLNTSLSELHEHGIIVYPIPTNQSLFINDKNKSASKLELFNVVGKRIISQNIVDQTTEVNTSQLSSGMYILQIRDHNNQVLGTTKIVKE